MADEQPTYDTDEKWPLNDKASDDFILTIKSPEKRLYGPHAVIFTHAQERWAIAALHWEKKPSLGIRWFWDPKGNPTSRGHRTWFIIPSALNHAILSELPLPVRLRHLLDEFFYAGKNHEALEDWQATKWPPPTPEPDGAP